MNCYWLNTGQYMQTYSALRALIPPQGDVKDRGRRLERFRRAGNVYYDLHTNGLCNRFGEVRTVLGITPRHYGITPHRGIHFDARDEKFLAAVEARMDEVILAAAQEQGIDVVELSAQERMAVAAKRRRQ